MLSPADFIFNDDPNASYLESEYHSYSPHSDLSNRYGQYKFTQPTNNFRNSYTGTTVKDFPSTFYDNINFLNSYLNASIPQFPSIDSNSIFFPGVRYLSEGIIVFERPPSYQFVNVDNNYRESINEETLSSDYYIPIPWQVYVCSYDSSTMRLVSVKMFFSNSSLMTSDQTLYCPPLFNFYSNGTLCRPFFPSMDDIDKYPLTISGIIASAFDWIWNSAFNYDLTENISLFTASKKYEQFSPWAEESCLDAYNILKNTKINHFARLSKLSYLNSFFECWSSVPLHQISSLTWCNYSDSEFYSMDWNNCSYFEQYIEQNNISIHECVQYSGEDYYTEYCSEDCDEDCECHLDCDCPSNSHSREEIINSYEYEQSINKYLSNGEFPSSKTLVEAINSSHYFLKSSDLLHKVATEGTFNSIFFQKFQ